MPIYEFDCKSCGHKLEKICSPQVKETDLACPECGKKTLKKCFSNFAYSSGSANSSFRSSTSGSHSCTSCTSHSCSTCH